MNTNQFTEILHDADEWDTLPELTVLTADEEMKCPTEQNNAVLTRNPLNGTNVSRSSKTRAEVNDFLESTHHVGGNLSKQWPETGLSRQVFGEHRGFLKKGGRVATSFAKKDAKRRLDAPDGRRKC